MLELETLDITQKEDDPHLPVPLDNTFETILPCVSHDNCTTNQSGRWLIDVCIDNQLYMFNSRTVGDFTGQFTCHTPRGSSVVDYFIASTSLSQLVHYMKVHDLTLFSLHASFTTRNIYLPVK